MYGKANLANSFGPKMPACDSNNCSNCNKNKEVISKNIVAQYLWRTDTPWTSFQWTPLGPGCSRASVAASSFHVDTPKEKWLDIRGHVMYLGTSNFGFVSDLTVVRKRLRDQKSARARERENMTCAPFWNLSETAPKKASSLGKTSRTWARTLRLVLLWNFCVDQIDLRNRIISSKSWDTNLSTSMNLADKVIHNDICQSLQ